MKTSNWTPAFAGETTIRKAWFFVVIPTEFPMLRLGAWHPRMDENPPSPPFSKGGLGGFESYFLTKPESGYFKHLKILWTPVSTGVTIFYENILIRFLQY